MVVSVVKAMRPMLRPPLTPYDPACGLCVAHVVERVRVRQQNGPHPAEGLVYREETRVVGWDYAWVLVCRHDQTEVSHVGG